jgi:transposase
MARRRYELTDREWAIIEPLLSNKPRWVSRVDGRRACNGIMWRFPSGATWTEAPERYGPATIGLSGGARPGSETGCWRRLPPIIMASW